MSRLCALALAAGLLLGAARAQDPAPPAALRPGDALLVRIDNLGGGLPAYREVVDSDGQVELPYLGMIRAAGKSIPELEAGMASAYANARLASNAVVTLSYVAHFDPPPDRANLVRAEDPRIPVPAPLPPAPHPPGLSRGP